MSLLENEQLLGKLVILEGYEDVNSELHKLCLPSLKLDGLFLAQKPPCFPLKLTPLAMPGSHSVTTNGGLMSPRSPSNSSSISETRLIDPSLVSTFLYFPIISANNDNPASSQTKSSPLQRVLSHVVL